MPVHSFAPDFRRRLPLLLLLSIAGGLLMLVLIAGARDSTARRAQALGASEAPGFLLPWQHGQSWVTGVSGFHTIKDALDFFPPDTPPNLSVRCEGDPDWVYEESSYDVLAAAPGTVTYAQPPQVIVDHGGGWSSGYWHMTDIQVAVGQQVADGTPLARPSTLGECATGPHVHFWVLGPNGATTRDVTLSGRPATDIGINEHISATGNLAPETTPAPQPTPTPQVSPPVGTAPATPTPPPTPTPTPEATPTPSPDPTPTPLPFVLGDADCDTLLTSLDALAVLKEVAGLGDSKCALRGDMDCNGALDAADALRILQRISGLSSATGCADDTPTPAPTTEPTAEPSTEPTPEATRSATPTPDVTVAPTPTATPSAAATGMPSAMPTASPPAR